MKQIHVSMSAASPEIRTYTGLKVVFTDHNPRHDLMLKRGEKFVIDGDKLYDPENKRIKFTMSKKEIKDLLANSRVAAPAVPEKAKAEPKEKERKLSDFGGYTMRNFKSYMTPRGVDYHAVVYKDGKALGTIHHIGVEMTPRLDFNIEQLKKDAKRLKFDDAYHMLSELSFVVETAAANKKK